MVNFVVIDAETGAILRTGVCPEADLSLQAGEGEAAIAAGADIVEATHFFDGTGFQTFPSAAPSDHHTFLRDQMAWQDSRSDAELTEALRVRMRCSRLQGRLTLGPEICDRLDAFAADPETNWAMRETILNASEWQRGSQTMDELAYGLGFTPEEMDGLFAIAMAVKV
jgi:hypothetical protein